MTRIKSLVGALPLSAALSIAFVAGACEGSKSDPAPQAKSSSEIPMQGPIPKKMRAIVGGAPLVEEGKKLFAACACHGPSGEGTIGLGPRLNSDTFLAAASDDMLVHTITKGRAGTTMIAWGASYKKEQIEAVVAYIRSLNPVAPATLDEAPLQGDPENGGKVFRDVCSGCHGRSGAGYQETANGTGIGRKAFLAEVSNGYLRHIVKHGKSATKMRSFADKSPVAVANLTDQEIDDVIAHLRLNAW